jgi:acyl-CoA-binding protein
MRIIILTLALLAVSATIGPYRVQAAAQQTGEVDLPEGYMPLEESQEVLDKTLEVTLAPDLSILTPAERGAAQKLLEAGGILQKLYENSLHHQARTAYESLMATDEALGSPPATQNLLKLFYLFKGPIIRNLDNAYVAILPVDARVPGKNVYPWGITKEEIDGFLEANPGEAASIRHLRYVVRRTEKDAIQADLAALDRYPVIDVLHPGLRSRLEALAGNEDENRLYAVPYSVAYANDLIRVYYILNSAADLVASDDVEFARFLRNRAVDLLRDDYEAGDASWVRGRFKHLNAQIGSYEVYDDELYATKTFFGMSLLLKDEEKSSKLVSALSSLQEFEESLPVDVHKKVQEDIPVGVYNVLADFGQARGTNTATILPNENYLASKYGRTILIRYNILTNPRLFAIAEDSWKAAVAERHFGDFKLEGNFYRTLWHEIGHYLGPDRDKKGRTLNEALEEYSQVLEELKADLVSLFLVEKLREKGYYDDATARAVYASGIRRVLLKNRPHKGQTYQTMELMQMNYFLSRGLLEFDPAGSVLKIDYGKYASTIKEMLSKVLGLQYEGDKAAARRFVEEYSAWDEHLHGAVSARMRATEKYRYVIVRYAALED